MVKSKKSNIKKSKKTRKNKKTLVKKCLFCMKKGKQCKKCANQIGGKFYKPAGPLPGPFIGQPWLPPVKDWPGVNGVGGDRNYLSYNNYLVDPQTAMIVNGGSKNKGKRTRKGGLLPQEFVNLGRQISFNMGSAYNALNGYPAPVNPLPYKDQLINSRPNG
jgi:hypothetical protein